MNEHVGTDLNGLVHTVVTTHAGASDFSQLPRLLHGAERELYGDQAYWSELHRVAAKEHSVRHRVNRRPNPDRPLSEYQRKVNRLARQRERGGEHAFNGVKRLWGYSKIRYRELTKNIAQMFATFALANLYMVR